jgi:hypothetical protein
LARACSDWPRTVGDWRRGSSQRRHLQFYHWLGRKVKRKSRREERRQASKGEKAAGAGRCWDRSGLLLRPVPRSRRGDAFFLRPLAVATWPAAAGRPSFPSSLPDFALSHAKPCSVSPLPFVMPCSVLGSTPTVLVWPGQPSFGMTMTGAADQVFRSYFCRSQHNSRMNAWCIATLTHDAPYSATPSRVLFVATWPDRAKLVAT